MTDLSFDPGCELSSESGQTIKIESLAWSPRYVHVTDDLKGVRYKLHFLGHQTKIPIYIKQLGGHEQFSRHRMKADVGMWLILCFDQEKRHARDLFLSRDREFHNCFKEEQPDD